LKEKQVNDLLTQMSQLNSTIENMNLQNVLPQRNLTVILMAYSKIRLPFILAVSYFSPTGSTNRSSLILVVDIYSYVPFFTILAPRVITDTPIPI